jgi:hypothetical protein
MKRPFVEARGCELTNGSPLGAIVGACPALSHCNVDSEHSIRYVRPNILEPLRVRADYVCRRVRLARVLDPGLRGGHTRRLSQLVHRKAYRFDCAAHTLLTA